MLKAFTDVFTIFFIRNSLNFVICGGIKRIQIPSKHSSETNNAIVYRLAGLGFHDVRKLAESGIVHFSGLVVKVATNRLEKQSKLLAIVGDTTNGRFLRRGLPAADGARKHKQSGETCVIFDSARV